MPLLDKQTLSRLAPASAARRHTQTETAKSKIHGQLARSQKHASDNAARLEAIAAAADAKHRDITAQIPALRAKAEGASFEERDEHHRNYLSAVQDRHNCARIHGAAMRELILAKNF